MASSSGCHYDTSSSDAALPDFNRPYPNLQVTQSMTKPRTFRREKSGCVDPHYVLTRTFGYHDYKGKQREVVEAAVRGADILVIAPTGMGKSICFQVPAIADKHGITLVVSPLLGAGFFGSEQQTVYNVVSEIALIKDQVARLKSLRVDARALTSETSQEEKAAIIRDIRSGHPRCRLLYLTPEKLCGTDFSKHLTVVYEQRELNRLVVDEAHCISEWGNDFRPEYRRLGIFRQRFPDTPVMALTASATPSIQDDIVTSLSLSSEHLLKVVHPFNRQNLFYEVRYISQQDTLALEISEYIKKLHNKRGVPSTGIIYCRTRQTCDGLANFLRNTGLGARPYHKGLSSSELCQTAKKWVSGGTGGSGVDVVCATTAFGLGIDKSDVRYVIHYDLPKSFEGYYQETGRAGRDGQPARCILYYSREDAVRVQALVRLSHSKRGMGPSAVKACETAEESLKALVSFAESVEDCRHVVICRYFGEIIDPSDEEVAKAYCDLYCDVCKDPRKTRKRKVALVSEDVINTQRIQLTQGVREEEEESPIAEIPGRVYPGFQSAAKAVWEPVEDHRSASTIPLPPPPAHNMKRPRDEYDDPVTGPNRPLKLLKAETHITVARSRPAFKVPSTTGPRVASSSTLTGTGIKERRVFYGNIPKREPKPHVDEPDADLEADERGITTYYNTTCGRFCRSPTPDDIPSDNETLDIPFSQKIPRENREEAVALLRKALWKGLQKMKVDDGLRQRAKTLHLDDSRRVALTNKVAHKIELSIFGMCRSKERYMLAAIEQEQAICLIFSAADHEKAAAVWDDTECDDENVQNARDIVRHLRQLCSRAT